ncbi:hypothetical protein B566_EDAN006164, partial [Ephemera danica]
MHNKVLMWLYCERTKSYPLFLRSPKINAGSSIKIRLVSKNREEVKEKEGGKKILKTELKSLVK